MKKENSELVGEQDILSDLTQDKGTSLFLGRYSLTEARAVLGKRNFFRDSMRRGLWPLAFDLDSSSYPVQRLRIFHGQKLADKLIVDLKIREGNLLPRDYLDLDPSFFGYSFLIFEWLTIQDPLHGFSEKRPPLPGQEQSLRELHHVGRPARAGARPPRPGRAHPRPSPSSSSASTAPRSPSTAPG